LKWLKPQKEVGNLHFQLLINQNEGKAQNNTESELASEIQKLHENLLSQRDWSRLFPKFL
jgi:hypothetical protein